MTPNQSRSDLEKERMRRQVKTPSGVLTSTKIYLVAYNLVSASLWGYLLYLTISHIVTNNPSSGSRGYAPPFLTKFFGTSPRIPPYFRDFLYRLRGSYNYKHLGWWTKWVQSLAVLEVVHSGMGIVRSPVGTTAAQVASRLWTVWGVVEADPSTHNNPLFTTMLFAWSLTEVIRYTFYAAGLLNLDIYPLNYLRYTTFLPLYPLGASSEAFLSLSTLPPLSTCPYIPNWLSSWSLVSKMINNLPDPLRKAFVKTKFGRTVLWNIAKAGSASAKAVRNSKAIGAAAWGPMEMVKLVLFCGWWPALQVLYTHMLKQRKKFLGKGKTVGGVNKAR